MDKTDEMKKHDDNKKTKEFYIVLDGEIHFHFFFIILKYVDADFPGISAP